MSGHATAPSGMAQARHADVRRGLAQRLAEWQRRKRSLDAAFGYERCVDSPTYDNRRLVKGGWSNMSEFGGISLRLHQAKAGVPSEPLLELRHPLD